MEKQLHLQLKELVLRLERRVGILQDIVMSCCNITPAQCHSLLEIGRAKNLSLIDLAETLGLDSSTISRSVNSLVNDGLVDRQTDPVNRRYVTISLTEDGEKIFEALQTASAIYYRKILQQIPKEKHNVVLQGLKLLLEAFDKSDNREEE